MSRNNILYVITVSALITLSSFAMAQSNDDVYLPVPQKIEYEVSTDYMKGVNDAKNMFVPSSGSQNVAFFGGLLWGTSSWSDTSTSIDK